MSKKIVIVHSDKEIELVYRFAFPSDHIIFIHYSTFNENYVNSCSRILKINPEYIVFDCLLDLSSFRDYLGTVVRKTNALIIFHKNNPFLDKKM